MNPREDIEAIFRMAVTRVDHSPMIERTVSIESSPRGDELVVRAGFEEVRYLLVPEECVFSSGMGKASARMTAGLERALGGGNLQVVSSRSRLSPLSSGRPLN